MADDMGKGSVDRPQITEDVKSVLADLESIPTLSSVTLSCTSDDDTWAKFDDPKNDESNARKEANVESKKFPCLVCGRRYSHQRSLKEHLRTHTMGNIFDCNFCGKVFAQKKILTEHLRTHTKEKPFQCQFCERKFPTRSTQRKHEATHVGEKRHKCNQCGTMFSGQGSLFYHLKVHSGERPFKCEQCEKTFITKSHLRRHIRAHTGEKPFVCPYCGLKVVRSGTLQNHIRKHTGENLYTCQHCEKKFYNKRSFDYHLKRHAGVKPFPCLHCDFRFTNHHHLKRHVTRAHKETIAEEDKDGKKLNDSNNKLPESININRSLGVVQMDVKTLASVVDLKRSNSSPGDIKERRRCSFICTYCPKEFVHKRSLEYHLKFHEKMFCSGMSNDHSSVHSIVPEISDVESEEQLDLEAALLCEIDMDLQSNALNDFEMETCMLNDSAN